MNFFPSDLNHAHTMNKIKFKARARESIRLQVSQKEKGVWNGGWMWEIEREWVSELAMAKDINIFYIYSKWITLSQ